jgi:hypothetical protein
MVKSASHHLHEPLELELHVEFSIYVCLRSSTACSPGSYEHLGSTIVIELNYMKVINALHRLCNY